MEQEYRVKGSTLNTKIAFVRERFGEEAVNRLIGKLSQDEPFKAFDSGWYPYEQYVRILELIAEQHFGGDLSRLVEAGEYSANQALSTTYAAFVVSGDFLGFLNRIAQLHSMFYSLGHIEVETLLHGKGCEIRHRGKSEYAEADMYVALGFYKGAGSLHGLQGVSGGFTRDRDGVTFSLSW